jgi:predicted negative regulator of RcsB-dependent stress response
MKKIYSQIGVILIFSLSISSCSWLSKRKALFEPEPIEREGVSSTAEKLEEGKVVSSEQYNQLLERYDKLKRSHDNSNMVAKPDKLLTDLNNAPASTSTLADTVDVFGNDGPGTKEPSVVDLGKFDARDRFPVSINAEIDQFRMAEQAAGKGDHGLAMKYFKILEKSQNTQLKVRAKYNIAEILFDQKDYDLAMQAYEEIIKNYAFSGLVIKSLGRLIACTEQLKLKEKKDKYYSILHDFFKQGR